MVMLGDQQGRPQPTGRDGDAQPRANLLSALAEAPDFAAAADFLLSHVQELSGSTAACLLQIDQQQENLVSVASVGHGTDAPRVEISLTDLDDPLTVATLSMTAVVG